MADKKKKIGVSVVIVTYNRPTQLKKALESVLAQKEIEFEIIVLDNASTDQTTEVVKSLQEKHPQIFYQKLDQNYGPCHARNVGFRKANFEIIFSLDDDAFLPTKTFLQTGAQIFWQKNLGILNTEIKENNRNFFFTNLTGNFYYTLDFYEGAAFLSKALTQKVKFDETLFQGAEGLDFAMQTIKNGFQIGITNQINIVHEPVAVHSKTEREFRKNMFNTAAAFIKFFPFYQAFIVAWGTFLVLLLKTKGNLKKLILLLKGFWETNLFLFKSYRFKNTTIKEKSIRNLILFLKRAPRQNISNHLKYSLTKYCLSYFK